MANFYTPSRTKLWVYAAAFALSFLIMKYVVTRMYRTHNPGRVNAARAEERKKARLDLEATAIAELNNGGDVDAAKGIKRLPIKLAMEMVVREWENPAAGRSNLVARSLKAAEPAPVAPPKPSEFE